jgi:hypothetical protein
LREISGREARDSRPQETAGLADDARYWLLEDLEGRAWVFTES